MQENLFITCAEYLEPLLVKELEDLGIEGVQAAHRGVFIPYNWENIFKANYLSRIATRVLLPLIRFSCPDQNALYREVKRIDWSAYLDPTKTFAIDATVSHHNIRHSLYAAQVVKDAICDQLRDKTGERPSIDIKNPDIQLNLLIREKRALLSFDTSGAPLYKRGWKEVSTEATLSETLASALLYLANYSSREVLCDPLCGTGTLLLEAACIATKTPAGYFRKKWGFLQLPEFSAEAWEAFRKSWDEKRIPLTPGSIIGADRDAKAIALCQEYVRELGFSKGITLIKSPLDQLTLPKSPTLVVTDPPFGKRMDLSLPLFRALGELFRKQCPAMPFAYMICPSFSLVKATGCEVLSERRLKHGGLKIFFFQVKA